MTAKITNKSTPSIAKRSYEILKMFVRNQQKELLTRHHVRLSSLYLMLASILPFTDLLVITLVKYSQTSS